MAKRTPSARTTVPTFQFGSDTVSGVGAKKERVRSYLYRLGLSVEKFGAIALRHRLSEIDPKIGTIIFRAGGLETLEPLPAGFSALTLYRLDGESFTLTLRLMFTHSSWLGTVPVEGYVDQLVHALQARIADAKVSSEVVTATRGQLWFKYRVIVEYSNLGGDTIGEIVAPRLSQVRRVESDVARVDYTASGDSLVANFSFPPEVKSSCEQYLLHFVDFLREIGVEATADIHESAGNVLFSVTPVEKRHALENIRAALEMYLRLPGSELSVTPSPDPRDGLVVQKLVANVFHLRSQIETARAQLALRDATIAAQEAEIAVKQDHIDLLRYASIAVQGVPAGTTESSQDESIAPYVAVTLVEVEGLKIDLPKFVRDVKKLFKRK
jgi:hypothetical protein